MASTTNYSTREGESIFYFQALSMYASSTLGCRVSQSRAVPFSISTKIKQSNSPFFVGLLGVPTRRTFAGLAYPLSVNLTLAEFLDLQRCRQSLAKGRHTRKWKTTVLHRTDTDVDVRRLIEKKCKSHLMPVPVLEVYPRPQSLREHRRRSREESKRTRNALHR